jgi:hypothetical protein
MSEIPVILICYKMLHKTSDLDGSLDKRLRETGWCRTVWIHLAQDRIQWKTLVNTVTKIRIS